MSAYKTDNGQLSTTNEACVVSTSLGHIPYTRHRHTAPCTKTPTTTHRILANDRPVSRVANLFDADTDTDED